MPPEFERPAIFIIGSVMALYGLIALRQRESGLIVQQRRRESIAQLFAMIMGTIWLIAGSLLMVGAGLGGSTGSMLVGLTAASTAVLFLLLFVAFMGIELLRLLKKPPEPRPEPTPIVLPSPPRARFRREQRVAHPTMGIGVVLDSHFMNGVERVTVMFYEEITTVDATSLQVEAT